MPRKNIPDNNEDLPILTAKQVSKYFNPKLRTEDVPKRYLMEAEEFFIVTRIDDDGQVFRSNDLSQSAEQPSCSHSTR